ncbi:MAG: cyclic nucleotide-binding domain-containing protein [Endomicrobium sp.]|uniref:cyclic nucleotide-binding domain-containing protein n=1 Tax=Candidatus Endomicrobiellum pyrsonymphae TaxID=1408203 RepID=UPI00357EA816|nr:cyclic nucleotide-binding domain-containing protein [Endomicrobium sp.]
MIKKLLQFIFIDDVLKGDIAFLEKIDLFRGLSKRSLAKIALIVFKKTYLDGEKIYEANQEANVVYIVKNGQIKLTGKNLSKVVESEDFFGERSLVENNKHDFSSIALKESELYLIYRAKFYDMAESDNKAGFTIMRNLASLLAAKFDSLELQEK